MESVEKILVLSEKNCSQMGNNTKYKTNIFKTGIQVFNGRRVSIGIKSLTNLMQFLLQLYIKAIKVAFKIRELNLIRIFLCKIVSN